MSVQEPAPVQVWGSVLATVALGRGGCKEWTNMLPRPSELLLSGLDERWDKSDSSASSEVWP